MTFTYHDYNKDTKTCRVCGRTFSSKPRADNCPGVPVVSELGGYFEHQLESINRKLKGDAKPIAYFDWSDFSQSKRRNTSQYIYSLDDTEIIDSALPPAYISSAHIPKDLNAISEAEMRHKKLEPKSGAKAIAVTREWGKDADGFYRYWLYYYKQEDVQPGESLCYITKGRLKSEYSLSDGWLKRLGKPDLLKENPHYPKSALMKLYNISRVKEFLQDNNDEYSEWLVKRQKYVLNYRRRLMIQKLNEAKVKHQNKLCLKCKFSNFSDDGILCSVNPVEFPDGVPMSKYCPDYSQ